MTHAVVTPEEAKTTVKTTTPPKTTLASVPKTPARNNDQPTGEVKRIGEMLSYRRPHGSEGEKAFVSRYIMPLKPSCIRDTEDEIHAYVVYVPHENKRCNRAFIAHVDSVHNRMNNEMRQPVGYDDYRKEFYVSLAGQRDCLGADDAAGCYVLLRMIEASVPGLYVFFRGEERGGIGSSYVTENYATLFDGIEYAIQFDRRGTGSIITEMMCGMTCSDQFAKALGTELGMGHVIDPTGSFTDTANLAEIVPECTNVSVGYNHEHSPDETLDAEYLLDLTEACITAFGKNDIVLPIKRKPADYGVTVGFNPSWPTCDSTLNSRDLVYMSRQDIRDRLMEMSFNEIVDAIYDISADLGEAYDMYGHFGQI